jgi:hypothetical protein
VVEVTSRTNAAYDRPPRPLKAVETKWSRYAYGGIPNYLLIDRDPRSPGITLSGKPNVRAGTYEPLRSWTFGQTIQLPDPLAFEFSTTEWELWDE